MDHHQISGENPGVEHGLAPDPQGEILPLPASGVKGKVVLDALLRQDGASRGHVAHNGHPVLGSGKLGQGDGPALPGALGDDPGLLQVLQVEMDGGGGFQSHCVTDFPDGGRIALGLDAGDNVVIDLLLHMGEIRHNRTSRAP